MTAFAKHQWGRREHDAWLSWVGTLLFCWSSHGIAAEPPNWLSLVKPATADSASSYGDLSLDSAPRPSLESLLGKPISSKEKTSLWIGSDGCRALGLKMVRVEFDDEGRVAQMTLEVIGPLPRSEVVEALQLGEPEETRTEKDVAIELFPSAGLGLGIHRDQVIRLLLLGGGGPGKSSMSLEEQKQFMARLEEQFAPPATQEEKDDALLQAALVGAPENVLRYLALGANPQAADTNGATALHRAASQGHNGLIPILVLAFIRPQQADSEDGDQQLTPISELLNQQDREGATALCLACLAGQDNAAVSLLRLGADPDVGDREGRRPLHLAVLADNVKLVETLLVLHADPYVRTEKGYAPGDLAASEEVRRLLSQSAGKIGDDPAKAEARRIVEAFLEATRDGDLDKMKLCVAPSLRDRMPAPAEKNDLTWDFKTIDARPGAMRVVCETTSKGEKSRTGFQLRYHGGDWRIADISAGSDTEPSEK